MMNMAITEVMQQTGSLWPDAHCDPRAMSRLALGVQRLTGAENLGVPLCMIVEAEAMGAAVTMGTVDSEPRVTGYPLAPVAEWPRLLMGTPEDVMREARDNLRQAYDNPKGYILSTGCDLPIETPRENILALMNAARLYGKWPIDPERLM
jgi:uroporphyrinogen-III decarboxylase